MVALSSKLALDAGCYWGTEKFIVKDFQKKFPGSIKAAQVGFMLPDKTDVHWWKVHKNAEIEQTGLSCFCDDLIVINAKERIIGTWVLA